MTVTLKALRYFMAAVRGGSIARASAELNVAASAVSAAIDQVEESFQLTLVTRYRSRGIELTADGRALARKFGALLEDVEALLQEGAEMRQALTGGLRIGYYAPVAPAFLPGIVAPLLADNPGLTLELQECDNDRAQQGLLEGAFDVILFVSDSALPAVQFDRLIEAPAYCLTPAGHRLARAGSASLEDLRDEPLVVLNRPLATRYYRYLFEGAGIAPRIVALADSTEMVRSLVGAGLGCAVLNMRPRLERSYAGDGLAAVPLEDAVDALTLSIGYTKRNPRRAVSAFVEACRDYFASGQAEDHIVAL